MGWLGQLTEAMPPPARPLGEEPRWEAVEAALGLAVPEDLKAVLALYGEGGIGGFLWLLHPASANPFAAMAGAVAAAEAGHARLRQAQPLAFPRPSLPEPGALLPWGFTDNGDTLGWVVEGGGPEGWPVAVLDGEAGRLQRFALRLGPFLLGLVLGRIRPWAFPADAFADLPPRWEPREG